MQRQRSFRGKEVSIASVVDDGQELASKLAEVNAREDHEKVSTLKRIVRPIVQECTSEGRCEQTGLRLQDIWRYFRHTWSLEYNPLPGRTQRFLIRNAARPFHPVMGIAMLASPTANLGSRDEWIGWQTSQVEKGLVDGHLDAGRVGLALLSAIRQAIEEIRHDDLIDPTEATRPGPFHTVFRLEQIAAKAEAARRSDLIDQESDGLVDIRDVQKGAIDDKTWFELSGTSLFVKKRAEQLAPLLRTFDRVETFGFSQNPATGLYRALVSSSGTTAIKTALNEIKKRRISVEIADLAVCGAITPYNDLLGGKLVTLLMTLQEVRMPINI